MLASYPGFLGKEVWIDPDKPTEVILVIRWATREAWEAVPSEQLKQVEQTFTHELGVQQQIIEAGEYHVQQSPQVSS